MCLSLLQKNGGSVRDALHVAVMKARSVDWAATYDVAFLDFGVPIWPLD